MKLTVLSNAARFTATKAPTATCMFRTISAKRFCPAAASSVHQLVAVKTAFILFLYTAGGKYDKIFSAMKLKKLETNETGTSDTVEDLTFNPVVAQSGSAGVNKTAALIAFLASLAAAAMVGAVAAMMYVNWELIAEA